MLQPLIDRICLIFIAVLVILILLLGNPRASEVTYYPDVKQEVNV